MAETVMLDACAFATTFVYSLEFASNRVPPAFNPFGLPSLCTDTSIPEWQRRIFADVMSPSCSWHQAGVSHMPESLLAEYGSEAVTFKFGRKGCQQLDCFGFADLGGKQCSSSGSGEHTIDTPAGPIRACRPACFYAGQLIPSNEHVYFDEKKRKCRVGLAAFRKLCLVPSNRDKVLTNIPPLFWDVQRQECRLTNAYCEAALGITYANGDCVLGKTQGAFEFLFGHSMVRFFTRMGRDAQKETRLESAWATALEESNAKLLSHEIAREASENQLLSGIRHKVKEQLAELDVPVQSSQEGFEAFPELSGWTTAAALLGTMAGIAVLRRVGTAVLMQAARATASFSVSLGEVTLERGAVRLGALLVARSIGVIAAESAVAALTTAANAMNPLMWTVEALMVLGFIFDLFDHQYNHVLRKEQLSAARKAFVTQFNLARGVATANGGDMGMVELTPQQVYLRLYGHFLDTKSPRYSDARVRTFVHYVEKYSDAVQSAKAKATTSHFEPSGIRKHGAFETVTRDPNASSVMMTDAHAKHLTTVFVRGFLTAAQRKLQVQRRLKVTAPLELRFSPAACVAAATGSALAALGFLSAAACLMSPQTSSLKPQWVAGWLALAIATISLLMFAVGNLLCARVGSTFTRKNNPCGVTKAVDVQKFLNPKKIT